MEQASSIEEAYNQSKYIFFIGKGNYIFYFKIKFYPIIIYNRPKKKTKQKHGYIIALLKNVQKFSNSEII